MDKGLFNAVIHNSSINDKAKMSHLKTLVKDKDKAAIAGLGCSGQYHTAWDTLVRNFGRLQTAVNDEMKLIPTYPFIKSHDSVATIKYAQRMSTCGSVQNQYGSSGDLSSESKLAEHRSTQILTSTEDEMVVLGKRKRIQINEFGNFSGWLKEVAFVQDELLIQFRHGSDKNSHSLQVKRAQLDLRCPPRLLMQQSSFNANTKPTNKCVVCGNAHELSACDAFKTVNPTDRNKKLKANSVFLTSVSDIP